MLESKDLLIFNLLDKVKKKHTSTFKSKNIKKENNFYTILNDKCFLRIFLYLIFPELPCVYPPP